MDTSQESVTYLWKNGDPDRMWLRRTESWVSQLASLRIDTQYHGLLNVLSEKQGIQEYSRGSRGRQTNRNRQNGGSEIVGEHRYTLHRVTEHMLPSNVIHGSSQTAVGST